MRYLKTMSLENGVTIIKSFAQRLPDSAGVYQMHNEKGEYLYIGKAKSLKKRVVNYTRPNALPVRLQRMIAQTTTMEFTLCETEVDALILEQALIKAKKPRYNILLRDDKSFPFMMLDPSHDYPRITKHRGKQDKGKIYFGPFASAHSMNRALLDIQKSFMIRNCTDSYFANRKRPCLQYHIKRCTAPCVGKVTKDAYAQQIKDALSFIEGDDDRLQKDLQVQMQAASDALAYERAAQLRDRIEALRFVQGHSDQTRLPYSDVDIFAFARKGSISVMRVTFIRRGKEYGHTSFYPNHDDETLDHDLMRDFIMQFYTNRSLPRNILVSIQPSELDVLEKALVQMAEHKVDIVCPMKGVKKNYLDQCMKTAMADMAMHVAHTKVTQGLLDQLGALVGLEYAPTRIEIYDNSHIQGAFKVGAYVVYDENGFNKKDYRQYNITETDTGDDFAMMREVMRRRILKINEGGTPPDLMIIDGGKGQMTQIIEIMDEFWGDDSVKRPAILGVAKGVDRNAGREILHFINRAELSLDRKDPLLHFIQRLRDESHRFVIGRHRTKREKSIESNDLGNLPQVGAVRKRALLAHFGSAKAVRNAGVKELQAVEGVSKTLAENIYKYYHE